MAEIRVLGPIQGFRDGEPADLGGPMQRKLLASLVARPGEVVSVATLLDDLWGAGPPPSGPQSIQSYVSRLRRALGQSVIETRPPGYRLGDDVDVDSARFVELANDLPDARGPRLEMIESALEMWEGPPFEDFGHVEFAARRLVDTRVGLEVVRARILESSGREAEAVAVLEKIVAAEPLRESAWVALSGILSRTGRQADAIRRLDRYHSILTEMGLEPGPAFEAAQDEAFETPPAPVRTPLPRAETTFIGRGRELDELRRLLGESRLVTVTGPGGMGKSRLAIEALTDWDGPRVTVARLASVRDDAEVAPTALHSLGGEARGDPVDAVTARLARDTTLLVLDNAEHVIEGVAGLASRVLARTATRMLVTSREPLNMPGEVVLTLDPMEPAAAMELYRERAKKVNPKFEASAATLAELCEKLDHMPLAIEMAAARSKALGPDDILTRLGRRYGLLDKPLRGGSGRHRSLDALVDWSYDLLAEREQRVFERLSTVVGTFDVESATAIAGFGAVPREKVPGALAGLVEKSLVNRIPGGTFRILRVLKSYAERRLTDSGDEETARGAHSRWFGELATRVGRGLSTAEETTYIEMANDAIEDLGAAVEWSADTGELTTAQTILEGLFDWLYHRHPPAIIGWGDRVLPYAGDHEVLSSACAWASVAAIKRGDLEAARRLALGGTEVQGPASRFSWFMTGDVACYQDRLEDAREAFRRQLVRASSVGDRIGVIDGVAGETIAMAFQGRFDVATELADELAEMASDVGAPTYRAYADYAMGEAIIVESPEESAQLLAEAAHVAASVNNQFIQAMARTTRGSVLSRLDRLDEAIDDLHEAAGLWESLVVPGYLWVVTQYLGAILAQLGEHRDSARILAAAERAGKRPFMAGQSHWADVVDTLQSDPDFGQWAADGVTLSLEEASALALSSTRRRR